MIAEPENQLDCEAYYINRITKESVMNQKKRICISTLIQLLITGVFVMMMVQPLYAFPPESMRILQSHAVESNHNAITREFVEVWNKNYLGNISIKHENRSGAGGRIAFDQYVMASENEKDGTYLLSANIMTTAIMYAQQDPDWDWFENLVPLGIYAFEPGTLIVQTKSEYQSLNDVIEAAKKRPLLVGTSRWVQGETLQLHQIMEATGAQFEIIPFGSGGATRAALLGGHVDMISRKSTDIQKAGGELRALSISADENIVPEIIGDVPTTREALGDDDIINVGSYRTFFVHKDAVEKNPELYEKLRETFLKAVKSDAYIRRAEKMGYPEKTMVDMTPEQLNALVKKNVDLFKKYAEHYKK